MSSNKLFYISNGCMPLCGIDWRDESMEITRDVSTQVKRNWMPLERLRLFYWQTPFSMATFN